MNQPSYFDDIDAAARLRVEALSWLGTPFMQYQPVEGRDVKGRGGGIDCVGLVQEILWRTGSMGRFSFPRTMADYQTHQGGERILDYLRGKLDDPQSKRLAEIFEELEIPSVFTDPNAESPRDFFKTGDVLILRHGSLFHVPLLYDCDLHFVSAVPRHGVMEGTIQDSSYSVHLVAAFRLRPNAPRGTSQ